MNTNYRIEPSYGDYDWGPWILIGPDGNVVICAEFQDCLEEMRRLRHRDFWAQAHKK